jgi:hypothetical protein
VIGVVAVSLPPGSLTGARPSITSPPQSPRCREPIGCEEVIMIGRERVPSAISLPFVDISSTEGGCDPGIPMMNVPGLIVSTALFRTVTVPRTR